jgi:hypothetical protein
MPVFAFLPASACEPLIPSLLLPVYQLTFLLDFLVLAACLVVVALYPCRPVFPSLPAFPNLPAFYFLRACLPTGVWLPLCDASMSFMPPFACLPL